MNVAIDIGFLTTLWMIFCRLSSFLLLSPLFAVAQVPVRIRVFLLLALAFALAQFAVLNSAAVSVSGLPDLVGKMLGEVLVGAVMGFGIFAAFAAVQFAGRLLDFQIGFSVASVFDPSTEEQGPLLGSVLNLTAVLTFFMVNGHWLLLESIAFSLERLPPGSIFNNFDPSPLVNQFGLMFINGFLLAAPVVFILLLVDVGMAVAARTMPQVNMFVVSLPLKILVGLTVFTMTLTVMQSFLEKLYRGIFHYIEQILLV